MGIEPIKWFLGLLPDDGCGLKNHKDGAFRASEVSHALVENCWHFNFTFGHLEKPVLYYNWYKNAIFGDEY